MKKEDEIRQLCESGILTKDEMEAELKKVTSAKMVRMEEQKD